MANLLFSHEFVDTNRSCHDPELLLSALLAMLFITTGTRGGQPNIYLGKKKLGSLFSAQLFVGFSSNSVADS